MIGFRLFAACLLVTATVGLTACGGDDEDGTRSASQKLQRKGIKKQDADELVRTAKSLKEQGFTKDDATKLQEATKGVQRRVTGLQGQIVRITRRVQSGELSNAKGNEQIATIAKQIQREALEAAERLDRAGALPPTARKQVEAAKEQLEEQSAGK